MTRSNVNNKFILVMGKARKSKTLDLHQLPRLTS